MKKLFLTAIIAVIAMVNVNAQSFGIKAGVDFATLKAKSDGVSVSSSETGFYIGAFTQIEVSETLNVRPEINYVNVEDLEQIVVPVLAEFKVADKFNLLAGPNFGFILDAGDGAKSFNFGGALGASYDITENFLLEARYNLGISDLLDVDGVDASLKLHSFQAGIGYRF